MARDPQPLLLGLGWPPDQTGGANRYFRDLLSGLPDAVGVVIGPAQDAPDRVTVVSDHSERLVRRIRGYSRAAALAATGADVVDAHFALYAALPVRRGPASRLPLVVHFQGPWAAEAAAEGASGWAGRACRTVVERSVYRRAALVVTLSGAFARILVDDYDMSPWRIRVLTPGVDLRRFAPGDRRAARVALGLPDDTPVVATVRRLVPRTGVDVLLDAWTGLDDGRALLVIAGDGPEREQLERRARRLGLVHVRFLGSVAEEALPNVFRAADLCVVPSTALEGFGLVAIESLGAGTPVVVTDAGGLPEAVAGLAPDLVVPAGDATALRLRIATALDGSAPLPTATQCRTHAERFDWARVVARHRQVYAEAVAPVRRPRVLFVDHCARLSGGEIALVRLLAALPEIDPHVLAFEDGPLLTELGAAGVTTEIVAMPGRTVALERSRIGARLPWRATVDTAVQTFRLARRLRRIRPDVVHANSLKASLVVGVAARLARVPSVWHARDVVDTDAYPRAAVLLVRALARRLPTAVVANSRTTLASLGLSPERGPSRDVIPDPLPDGFFAPVGTVRPPLRDEPVIGMVGRIAPWKGQHVFLDAFARAFADGGAHAVIVGGALFGEDAYCDALHEQAATLGIAERVEFRGFRRDVRAELATFDVLVHASVQPEPFGQVVVEGMAAGLPVVASRAGGPAEIIRDGEDGVLVPAGDADALAGALRGLAGDPARRRELGDAARVSATRYRAAAVAPRFLEVYLRLQGRR